MSLRNQVVDSLKWVAVSRIISQIFKWASTFLVIRILMPSDYGVVAIAEIVFSFLLILSIDGFGAPIIQTKQLNKQMLGDIFGSLIVVNLIIMLLMQLLSPYIALYYDMPEVSNLIQLLSIGLVFITFTVIPSSLLSKTMQFRQKSLIELGSSVISALVTVVLAYNDYGAYSLIYGHLSLLLSKAVLLNIVEPFYLKPTFSISRSKNIYHFGFMVTMSGILWFFYTNVDVMIAGKLWEPGVLGIYVVAIQLTVMPIDKIMPLIQSVAFPAYSLLSIDEYDKINKYSLKSARLMMFVVLPVYTGIASIASVLIPVVLGEKWNNAILPVMMLCAIMPFRVIFEMYDPLFTSLNKMRFIIENISLLIIIMVPSFIIGAQYSILGLCLAWIIMYPIAVSLVMFRILSFLKITKSGFIRELAPSIFNSIVMFLVVYAYTAYSVNHIDKLITLITSIILGAVIYLLLSFMFNRKTLLETRSIMLWG